MPAIRRRRPSPGRGSISPAPRAGRSRRSPTASSRPIRKRPAARMPAARCLSTGNSPALTAGRTASTTGRRSRRAPRTRARSPKTDRREQYRKALAALDEHCKAKYAGKAFAELSDERQGRGAARASRAATLKLDGADGKAFFEQVVKDIQKGFFADPIYGGNRDMAAWKMIGYPGRPLQLSRLDRPSQRALSAAARQHHRPRGMDAEAG